MRDSQGKPGEIDQERDDRAAGEGGRAGGGVSRRRFIELSAMAAVVAQTGRMTRTTAVAAGEKGGIPYRLLGHTGEKVSLVGIGGAHIGRASSEQEGIRIVRAALDGGINFLDNSWDYNDGKSEAWMGKALAGGYRQKAFLMTKIDGRTKESAAAQLNESLKRLQTDHLDLLQLHEIIRMNDPDRIFAPGGAIEAVVEAKKAGKIRYIGFTGHKSPDIHLHMLETAAAHGFSFDTVQMPLNVMDAHFNSFEQKVLPVAVSRNMGILGMKPMGDHIILKSNVVTPIECLHYTMNLPVSVCITGCDKPEILEQAIQAAKSFQPMSQGQVAALLAKTAPVAMAGKYELYKTSEHFDSTAQHPNWLG
jgi:predicted aldo/keto reductase-like oxidoreductase